jgi:glycosyltransferase involved in cell wall biosynthesis
MRLGFDAKRLFNNITGLGNYGRTLVQNLERFYPADHLYLYTPEARSSSRTKYFLDQNRFRIRTAPSLLDSLWRSWGITKALVRDGVELYHGLSNELPLNIRKSRLPTVVTIHDLIFKVLPDTYPAVDRVIYDYKVRRACANADHIIAISENTKRDITAYYDTAPEKISVVYQACDPVFYDDSVPTTTASLPQDFLLYVGAVTDRKNLKGIIEALAGLPSGNRPPLVVVGSGGRYMQHIRKLATQVQVRCSWLDSIDSALELKSIYLRALALAYPSRYEGFGLPVAEALLCGTPVITSKTSSLPEAGGHSSVYVDPGSIEELREAITDVLGDTDKRETMKRDGQRFARARFDPVTLTTQLHKLYERVLSP